MKTPTQIPKHISRAEAQVIINTHKGGQFSILQMPMNNHVVVSIRKAHWEKHPTEDYNHIVHGETVHHFKTIGKTF